MQPLNPFISAFFKSSLASQCSPPAHHILLVPATDVLLTSRDAESGASASDLVVSEEFLGSHVLRIPIVKAAPGAGGREVVQNLREMRGKAKQYNTVNGRSVVIKDNTVYSNKGFKSLAHATLLSDSIWYPDTLEPKPWIIYYLSQPLVGSWEEVKTVPAIVPEESSRAGGTLSSPTPPGAPDGPAVPRKKDIKSFHDLLNSFPLIARQMQSGLEKLFREFTLVFERPLPPPPSSAHIPDPEPDGPITTAMKRARSGSATSANRSGAIDGLGATGQPENFPSDDDEDVMRASLETAVTAAIDLFQAVDRQQLSLLGATTDLTGPVVERLIERYVTENVHHTLFPRLCAIKRQEDLELQAKIRQMDFIDISQLGLPIEGGSRGKQELTLRLTRAVEEFRKLSSAMSPQEMIEVLLSTMKSVTQLTDLAVHGSGNAGQGRRQAHPVSSVHTDAPAPSEKAALTINADTLVSLLLFVVIRAQVRQLHSRLLYIRHFIFVDDVENGEMGYALSTFEAVLTYLDRDSGVLRRASRRNKALWDATVEGDVAELRKFMEPCPDGLYVEDVVESPPLPPSRSSPSRRYSKQSSISWSFANGSSSARSSSAFTMSERFSLGSSLNHVFPFQSEEEGYCRDDGGGDGEVAAGAGLGAAAAAAAGADDDDDDDDDEEPAIHLLLAKRVKMVTMDTRSMSSGSEMSFHSRATSIGTLGSVFEADTSLEKLSKTQNSLGESVLMMAVQNEREEALRYLLSLRGYFPSLFVLEDGNNEGTTLLSAAVQLGHEGLIRAILDFLVDSPGVGVPRLMEYFAIQDIWGRSVAHYLFHAPLLIAGFGRLMPWRQRDKNGQTPLFALCRSYDHSIYHRMVSEALDAATECQGDGQPLHLDHHVDAKGNTLLHIVNDAHLALHILHKCDVDVNATNDKKFTPLMVASKYGRFEMVRALFGDPRVDIAAKELRGLTAVELAKDDDVRNKIDDLTLFAVPPGPDLRTTAVVRAYFVEDATIRFVLKSGAPADKHSYTVTTCRRSLADFEHLAKLLAMENPASWIPYIGGQRSPFQIPSKPSRAALKDLQLRMDWFLRIMLSHPTFATHEMLWEFFLVPDLQPDMMEQRSKLKAETRAEKVREEFEPLDDVREVEQFVDHAREMVRGVNYSTKSVARRTHVAGVVAADLFCASRLFQHTLETLPFLPTSHVSAFVTYVNSLSPPSLGPHVLFHAAFIALQSTIEAILGALARPHKLVSQIDATKRQIERNYNTLGRSTRWPLGLLDDTRQRLNEEREQKARQGQMECKNMAKELRYSQQVVAGELAGWQEMHEKVGIRAIKELARGMLVMERMRLEGMKRALRTIRTAEESDHLSPPNSVSVPPVLSVPSVPSMPSMTPMPTASAPEVGIVKKAGHRVHGEGREGV